jgi:uncharacterized protein
LHRLRAGKDNHSMKDFVKRYGDWALIAGAAEGLGAAFTEKVAAMKINVIMADIQGTSMKDLAMKVEKAHGIKTIQIEVDLAEEDAWMKCLKAVENLDCRLMIYLPAFSPVKLFTDTTPAEVDRYIDLNCRTPIKMVLEFGKRVMNKEGSGIILMSSLAGLIGPQYTAPYAGTKAFTNIFGEALHHEFKRYKSDVLVCCAGPVSTITYWSSKPAQKKTDSNILDPFVVAEYALKNLGKKAICIPGWRNRVSFYLLNHILPRKTSSFLVNKAMKKLYPQFQD